MNILTWGAVVQDLRLSGVDYPLTLGSDRLSDYEGDMRHHGSLIGPIVNRISTARLKIAGLMYELERNQDGRIHLHSGADATMLRVWDVASHSTNHVTLTCALPDGACGLPGNRMIHATYTVAAPATLTLTVDAVTDETTAFNFANHSYWNLDGTRSWAGHSLCIAADRYLPGTPDNTPTGEIADVAGSAMDCRTPQLIAPDTHMFDTNFCLANARRALTQVLTLTGRSGVTMHMATTEPGLQIYDGRDARRPGKPAYEGLAIEAQAWPDAPNHRGFPSILVTPDAAYQHRTQWRFSR